MQANSRPKYTKYNEPKNTIRLGDFEDEDKDKGDFEERPPCRQNSNVFDLEDNFYPVYFR